jgi:hypothetical protein
VLVEESGRVNFSNSALFHKTQDPLDCVKVPDFSKGNRFVKGLEKVLTPVPDGGIILYNLGDPFRGPRSVPAGFVLCDGRAYLRSNGDTWVVPQLDNLGTAVYIQKLPSDVTLEEDRLAIRPVTRRL